MSSGFLNCDLGCCLAGLLGLFPKEDARPRPVNNGASLTEITNAPGFIPRGSKLFRDAPGAAGQPQPAFASLPITHFRRGPTTPDPPTRPHPLSTDHAPPTPLRWPLLCWPQPLLPSPRFCPCNGGYPRRLCPAHSTASPLRPRP